MDIKLEVAEEEYILPGSPPPSEQFEESEETPVSCLLPDKSRPLYEISYKRFLNWQRQHHTTSFSQRVLIEYFTDLSKKWKSSTLWSEFSKVGKMLKFEHNVDVGQYRELKAFLKQMSVGYKAKKCKTLTGNDVERYWNEAPDQSCLAIKFKVIFGNHFDSLANILGELPLSTKAHSRWGLISILCIKGANSYFSSVQFAARAEGELLQAHSRHSAPMAMVAMIFGVIGACRREELARVEMSHLSTYHKPEDTRKKEPILVVHIPNPKTNEVREFTVKGKLYEFYQKYIDLRPSVTGHNRFFVTYRNGRCTMQPIGEKKFAAMPKRVAEFLKLPHPELYTADAFRRTSALLLPDSEADAEASDSTHSGPSTSY